MKINESEIKRLTAKLYARGKTRITKAEMEELCNCRDDERLASICSALSDNGVMIAISKYGTNGNAVNRVFMKYKVCLPKESYEEDMQEIKRLHPFLLQSGYLQSKPSEFRKWKKQVEDLSSYLFARRADAIPISRKERSFEIFSEEKQLDNTGFCALLAKLGCTPEVLCYYDTPELCFNDFILHREEQMTLLICENKDIWFNLRRRMFEDHADTLFGQKIDGVVLGMGNKVSGNGALTAYARFMGAAKINWLYWGDIDRAGLNIFCSTVRGNPDLHIQPFSPGYEQMLTAAQQRQKDGKRIPDSEDGRALRDNYNDFYNAIPAHFHPFLSHCLDANKRIPQEIVTYETLTQNMR